MKIVNVRDARTHLSRLLQQAHEGEEVVIAKRGKPYARLVPLAGRQPKREPGTLAGLVKIGDQFFDPLPERWG